MPVDLVDDVRVSWPDGWAAAVRSGERSAEPRGGVRDGATPGDVALAGALFPDGDARLVAVVVLTADETRRVGGDRPGETAQVATIDLLPDRSGSIVVSMEHDGVLRWVGPWMPTATVGASGSTAASGVAIALRSSGRSSTSEARRRAFDDLDSYLAPTFTLRVFRRESPSAPPAIRPQIVDVGASRSVGPTVARDESGDRASADGSGAGRMLLAIHDAFASTRSGFGDVWSERLGETASAWTSAYDRIVGFDHDAWTETPEDNARRLSAALIAAEIAPGTVIDVLAVGRGGLVARAWMEDPVVFGAVADRGVRVDRAVFVACANGGTPLAEPSSLCDLIDVHTTLFAEDAGLVGAPVASRAAQRAGALAGLARIGALIGRLAATTPERPTGIEERLPGLAAMGASSDTVRRLNDREEAAGLRARYRSLCIDHAPSPAEGATAAGIALAAVADDLFEHLSNDLVVDIVSASAFGRHGGRLDDRMVIRSSRVRHTTPLLDGTVIAAVASWLGDEVRWSPLPPLPTVAVDRRLHRRSSPAGRPRLIASGRMEPDPDWTADAIASRRRGGGEATAARAPSGPSDGASQATPLQVVAAMTGAPPVGRAVPVEVSLSPSASEAVGRSVSGSIEVDGEARLDLRLIALRNGRVLGADAIEGIAVPRGNRRDTWIFSVVCDRPGPASFQAEVWNGAMRLFVGRLEVTAGAGGASSATASGAIADACGGHEPLVTLRIVDRRSATGDTELEFSASGLGLNVEDATRLDGRTYDRFIDDTTAELETIFAATTSTASTGERLRALGLQMADALLPPRIRAALWEKRGEIEAILIIATEQQLPWEVVHVDDPASDEPGFFLAEKGLTRWFRQVPLPSPRRGRSLRPAYYVKPDYRDPRLKLAFLDHEIAAIEGVVGPMQRRQAQSQSLVSWMRSRPQIGILHFCGHGDTGETALREGQLLLQDHFDPAANLCVHDVLDSRLMGANVRIAREAASIVFLNVCRAGRATRGLIGVAGYAKAFVAPRSGAGAGVFVGAGWSVVDAAAAAFAGTFYARLAAGEPLHAAATAARAAARSRDDTTWLAYCVYGDPGARFSLGSGT